MTNNIALIGIGPHAKRIYIPFLKKYGIKPSLVVDLESNKSAVSEFLSENDISADLLFVNNSYKDLEKLPKSLTNEIKERVRNLNINKAIVATEPKSHKAYIKLFLDSNIDVLTDKPLTAPKGVIQSTSKSKKIFKDFLEIEKKVVKSNQNLIINCQRRFHPGYLFIYNYLKEFIEKHQVPITYINLYHCDGMWNMPDEFHFRENHPYKYGYGKIFHSGYHFIDTAIWLSSLNENVKHLNINKAKVYTSPFKSKDSYNIMPKKHYMDIFNINHDELPDQINTDGELDIVSNINLYDNKKLVSIINLELLQTGFSKRSWHKLPKDTYKGNGRVRHERLNIQVGPLLNIQVHSYQSDQKSKLAYGGHGLGEYDHFDILIFRNNDLVGGKSFEKISSKNLITETGDSFIGLNESARDFCIKNFLDSDFSHSNIFKHKRSIKITEKIYESIIKDKPRKFAF
tara:strand:- start:1882 stop:3252 length:1371 start_codon:yes stop_codon:yes gene_type:complete